MRRGVVQMMKKARSIYCTHLPEVPPPPPGVPDSGWRVNVTKEEKELFDVLKATRDHFKMQTIPRVAGGWVRDKLLKTQSTDLDIDVALDDCSGEDFANKVNEYLKLKGEATKSVGVIKANPDQSKHLATATVKIHSRELDFVNLRSETYEGDSRIPKIEIGTPIQDAERRDFTVNSMFYNIITEQVEDLTGKGLVDLANGILRTPLPASITFRDDPLRMLRAIRFASRYGFRLDDDLCDALGHQNNAVALENKVSNERVGIEIDKSLCGARPRLALEFITYHNLCDAIFKVPKERYIKERLEVPPRVDWITGLRIVEAIDGNRKYSDPTAFYLAAFLFPLGMSEFKKGKRESVVKHIANNSLKLGNSVSDKVYNLVRAATELSPYLIREELPDDRLMLGRLLFEVKDAWVDGLSLSLAVLQAARAFSKDEHEYVQTAERRRGEISYRIMNEWKLHNIWERLQTDPIIDGTELMALLKIKGAEVRKAVFLVRDFAFLNDPPAADTNRPAYVENAKGYVLKNWS